MNLILAESLASPSRIRQIAAIKPLITTIVHPDGHVEAVDDPETPLVMLLQSRKWPTLWTLWGGTYHLPPALVVDAVWEVVTGILSKKTITKAFGGAFKHSGFVWGCVPNASGICAKERSFIGGGGLFLEHFAMAKVAGLSTADAYSVTVEAARRGGVTPIPTKKGKEVAA